MEWQQDGELSSTDLHDLVSRLQRIDADANSRELGRLSRLEDEAA
ncbi:hypothetical protein [Synechococcus sp. CC9616]|jgi:hypothetical protein|nr:hypothetical protein [Synechococcus sp. CC9616]|tara:strand:+ start:522 stop:656 length:135 start_codon:yes stop_codon:yes gene_type:complete